MNQKHDNLSCIQAITLVEPSQADRSTGITTSAHAILEAQRPTQSAIAFGQRSDVENNTMVKKLYTWLFYTAIILSVVG